MLPSSLNFPEWLSKNKHRLQPPVCNCVFQEGDDYQIMVVGGPNSRTDFHINPTEEWFYQVKGRMLLRMADPTTNEIKDEYIEEGGMLLLPAMTPHSPNRFADTVGLVVERKRPGQKEAMRWYCEQCNGIVHEKWFICESLDKDLVPVIQEYKDSEAEKADMSDTPQKEVPVVPQLISAQTEVSKATMPFPRKSPSSLSSSSSSVSEESSDEKPSQEQFFEATENVSDDDSESASRAPSDSLFSNFDLKISVVSGVDPDGSLQQGIDVAMRAIWLFLSSDFEAIEKMLEHKRHSLMYASEGYAAIQYLRAMMSFTKEAMRDAQQAADSTINLASYYRKPRGVGALLSGANSRPVSRSASPQVARDSVDSQNPAHLRHYRSGSSLFRGMKNNHGANNDSSSISSDKDANSKHGSGKSWFRLDSPRLALRGKKDKLKENASVGSDTASVSASTSVGSMQSAVSTASNPEQKQLFDQEIFESSYGELQISDDADIEPGVLVEAEEQEVLVKQPQRSWVSGFTGVADSLIGIVRAGSQAVGIGKPDWHALKTMTPTQRHAELVHAEAYLLRAMINIAIGDGVLSVLKEGWHVRSAYAIYRNCYTFIQDAYANGETVDDHFVSGTYLGIGVFNLVLSMLPSRLLRFIELVGFSADRKLGLELLAIAAGWRSNPQLAGLMPPPPKGSESVHPCGYGLRSEFCAMVLEGYHVFLCSSMYLGYPNMPLAQAVLKLTADRHPRGLITMYFIALLHMTRRQMDSAVDVFTNLVGLGKNAAKRLHAATKGTVLSDTSSIIDDELIVELAALQVADSKAENATPSSSTTGLAGNKPKGSNEWRQLQYLGFWERSLCYMAMGMWMDAARGFNKLRKENNWNKAVYTYSLACCIWEAYVIISGGTVPTSESKQTKEQQCLLEIVCKLMTMVPRLQRKVVGKSIPVEKYVIRKARKFEQQGNFLMRPGVELVASWNLFSKIPYDRLQTVRREVDAGIDALAQYEPKGRSTDGKPYRHAFYYDDLAILLLLKACCLHEISMPSCIYNLRPPAAQDEIEKQAEQQIGPMDQDITMQPELCLAATDTYLRLLRLSPLIERDHYLPASARFYLGNLYLSGHSIDSDWMGLARAQWKCILGGHPVTAAPFLSLDEYRIHKTRLQLRRKEGSDSEDFFAAEECLVEERILQSSGHVSLRFYEDGSAVSEWSHCPVYWSESKKYTLQNALEVRTFNSENRLGEALANSKADK
ncbi:hypothetical protein GGF40_000836 [Coemansia sp. RSA 1286]|nr:hypothetical protein GGF40_000836 [Coemansia sp. RSA 1286]